jgi:hypothetical protein
MIEGIADGLPADQKETWLQSLSDAIGRGNNHVATIGPRFAARLLENVAKFLDTDAAREANQCVDRLYQSAQPAGINAWQEAFQKAYDAVVSAYTERWHNNSTAEDAGWVAWALANAGKETNSREAVLEAAKQAVSLVSSAVAKQTPPRLKGVYGNGPRAVEHFQKCLAEAYLAQAKQMLTLAAAA